MLGVRGVVADIQDVLGAAQSRLLQGRPAAAVKVHDALVGIGRGPCSVYGSREHMQPLWARLQGIGLGRSGVLYGAVLRIGRVVKESQAAVFVGRPKGTRGIFKGIVG